MIDPEGDGVLVSTDWLAAHLGSPDLRIVDIRGKVLPPTVGAETARSRYHPKREDYDASHVPGAVFVDWTRDIVDTAASVPAQIASPATFGAAMAARGIGDSTLVVAYDDYDHIFAGRLSWALRYYGHDAVRVLEGGWARWVSEGRATTNAVPSPAHAVFTPRPQPALYRTASQVASAVGDPSVLLIDARPRDQYAGAKSAAARAGHIPGARNVPYPSLIDPKTGRFLPREELAAALSAAGIDLAALPREVIVYCNGGVSCTVPEAALRMLGRNDVAVYDGSWNEWGNDASLPLRSGPDP